MVMKDRQLKMSEIDKVLDIPEGSVHTVLHDHLDMRKLCAIES